MEIGTNECNTKYQPQKNQSITISPGYGKKNIRKRSSRNKIELLRNRIKYSDDEQEDDSSVNSTTKHSKKNFKNCIKKRLNNNYEKQINSANDENTVFTDNKIYISLNGCNSSIIPSIGNGTNSLLKNRRVIYPTSGSYKLTGILRDCDFNYDYKNEATVNNLEVHEKFKYNLMKESCAADSEGNAKNVVFEKVKYISSKKFPASDDGQQTHTNNSIFIMHIRSKKSYEQDKASSNDKTFNGEYSHNNNETYGVTDEEDDLQWSNFMEHRKHCNGSKNKYTLEMNNTIKIKNDSGFGSQLLLSLNNVEKNLRNLELGLDDEIYDNSFNEELERRVQKEFPELYKSPNSGYLLNNINKKNYTNYKLDSLT